MDGLQGFHPFSRVHSTQPVVTQAILQDPTESDRDKLSLLHRLPSSEWRGVDAIGIVAREIERGNLNASGILHGRELSAGDRVNLDRAFFAGMEKGKTQWWMVSNHLRSTGRKKWADIRPFIEDGLRRGGDVTVKFAHSMVWLPELPPVEYVRNVIDSYELPQATVTQLKNKYKLE